MTHSSFCSGKWGRLAGTLFATLASAGLSQAEEMHAYFAKIEDPLGANLSISPCTGEEVYECVHHSFGCSGSKWQGPKLSIIVGPIEQIASKLIIGTEGAAKGTLKLSEGAVNVEARINAVELATNEMDGGWLLDISFANGDTMFDAITEKSSVGAKLEVGGVEFDLAPERGDAAKLVELKNACLALP